VTIDKTLQDERKRIVELRRAKNGNMAVALK
jgi:hypothetical protein